MAVSPDGGPKGDVADGRSGTVRVSVPSPPPRTSSTWMLAELVPPLHPADLEHQHNPSDGGGNPAHHLAPPDLNADKEDSILEKVGGGILDGSPTTIASGATTTTTSATTWASSSSPHGLVERTNNSAKGQLAEEVEGTTRLSAT